jgi:arginine repressor
MKSTLKINVYSGLELLKTTNLITLQTAKGYALWLLSVLDDATSAEVIDTKSGRVIFVKAA